MKTFLPSIFRWLIFNKSHEPVQNVAYFVTALKKVAPKVDRGSYAFYGANGKNCGFAQLITESDRQVTIHRLWTAQTGRGNGTIILKTLCELADAHGVELLLKVLPIGRKPYPMTREQLKKWYEEYGFVGKRWKLLRMPKSTGAAVATAGQDLPGRL